MPFGELPSHAAAFRLGIFMKCSRRCQGGIGDPECALPGGETPMCGCRITGTGYVESLSPGWRYRRYVLDPAVQAGKLISTGSQRI
jgi:hypothetical protein